MLRCASAPPPFLERRDVRVLVLSVIPIGRPRRGLTTGFFYCHASRPTVLGPTRSHRRRGRHKPHPIPTHLNPLKRRRRRMTQRSRAFARSDFSFPTTAAGKVVADFRCASSSFTSTQADPSGCTRCKDFSRLAPAFSRPEHDSRRFRDPVPNKVQASMGSPLRWRRESLKC